MVFPTGSSGRTEMALSPAELFHLTFLQHALAAGVLVGVLCGIVGTLVVVNRLLFLSGSIAHASYGGIGIALFLGLSPLLGAAVFAVLCAAVMGTLSLRHREQTEVAIGVIWAAGMAVGIIFSTLAPGYKGGLMSYLFGSILTVPKEDILLMGLLLILVSGVVAFFYKELLSFSFDREHAQVAGVPVRFFYHLILAMVALVVVMSIRVVGLILVIALLSIPPAIAERFSYRLTSVMLIAAVLGILFTVGGLVLSLLLDIHAGATIVLFSTLGYGLSLLFPRRVC